MSHTTAQTAFRSKRANRLMLVGFTALFATLVPTGCDLRQNYMGSPQVNSMLSPDQSTASQSTRQIAHIPKGWRRTKDGWEHASTWFSNVTSRTNRSINQLIEDQRQREPILVRDTLARLRSISPLVVALFQIAAIAMVCQIERKNRVT